MRKRLFLFNKPKQHYIKIELFCSLTGFRGNKLAQTDTSPFIPHTTRYCCDSIASWKLYHFPFMGYKNSRKFTLHIPSYKLSEKYKW